MLLVIAYQSLQFQQNSFSKLHTQTLNQIGEKAKKLQFSFLSFISQKKGSAENLISENIQQVLTPDLTSLQIIYENEKPKTLWKANSPNLEETFKVTSDPMQINNETISLSFIYDKRSLLINVYKQQKLQKLLTVLLITIIFIFATFGLLTLQAKSTQKKNRILAEMKQLEFKNQLDLVKLEKSEKEMRLQVVEKEEQLQQADKLTSLGMIASGVAHEINNPNTYIHLNAETLQKAWVDMLKLIHGQVDDQTKIAGIPFKIMKERIPTLTKSITEGSERITKIISDLKEFASTQDSQDKKQESINIKTVIETSIRLTENFIHKATDHFHIINDENIYVIGSAQKLEQVIINLLINSSQSLTEKNQPIEISTKATNDHAIIMVQDEGCGIPDDAINNIFDPFFSTKKGSGGTGLGLSISFGIIKEMNGTIQAKKNEIKGTIFTITLPLTNKEDHS